jgi:hypothetical protein
LFIGGSFGPSQSAVDAMNDHIVELNDEINSGEDKLDEAKATINEIKATNKELQTKVDEAEPFFKLSEQERAAKAAELKKKEEEAAAKEKAEAEKKEAEAKRLAEEEEKKGYETGITYNQLARTPDDYIGEKVKFRGKVVQVIEGDGTTQIRFAVGENYDTILFGEFDSSIVGSRVLEDDVITIMGVSSGLLTYESTMGGDISIPGMLVEKIEQ